LFTATPNRGALRMAARGDPPLLRRRLRMPGGPITLDIQRGVGGLTFALSVVAGAAALLASRRLFLGMRSARTAASPPVPGSTLSPRTVRPSAVSGGMIIRSSASSRTTPASSGDDVARTVSRSATAVCSSSRNCSSSFIASPPAGAGFQPRFRPPAGDDRCGSAPAARTPALRPHPRQVPLCTGPAVHCRRHLPGRTRAPGIGRAGRHGGARSQRSRPSLPAR
jgi:hypothetical protein